MRAPCLGFGSRLSRYLSVGSLSRVGFHAVVAVTAEAFVLFSDQVWVGRSLCCYQRSCSVRRLGFNIGCVTLSAFVDSYGVERRSKLANIIKPADAPAVHRALIFFLISVSHVVKEIICRRLRSNRSCFSRSILYCSVHLCGLSVLLFFLLARGLARRGFLFGHTLHSRFWSAVIDEPDLAEVAQEVGPHHVVLVDVGALDLRHCDEVIRQKQAVILADSAHLRKALIAVKEELLAVVLQLLRLFRQHEAEGLLLVNEELFFAPNEVVLGALKAPPRDVLRLEQLLLAFEQVALLLDEVLFDLLSQGRELSEGLMLAHMVLQVAAKVYVEQVTQVGQMIARTRAHLRQPCVQLVHAVDSDHVVHVGQLLEVFPQCVHCLGQLSALLTNLPRRLDDLLVEDLVAVGEVCHARAEDHGVLVHVHRDLAFLSDELDDGLPVLGLLEDLVRFLELLQIFNLQKVVQADGRFEFFTPRHCL